MTSGSGDHHAGRRPNITTHRQEPAGCYNRQKTEQAMEGEEMDRI
jgi:hypothetical protein